MRKAFRTRSLVPVAAVVILATGVTASASNMGFKIAIPFTAGVTKFTSVPYFCRLDGIDIEGGTATATNLRNELVAAGGGSVEVYHYTGSGWQRWAGGGFGQVNFTLQSGTGYQVLCSNNIASWIVVGSHNDTLTVPFSSGVTKFISWPYHSTASTADNLRTELVAAGGGAVEIYNYTGSGWQRWAGGGFGQVNFTLTPGLAYQVLTSSNIAAWTPAHY